MGVIFRYKNGRIIPIQVDDTQTTNEYMNGKIKGKKEERINDHTIKYNGYYIMPAKPNVGYKYEKIEDAKWYSIYDDNNDDITHNLANWIGSLQEAKEHIDSMKKWGIYK